jgi:hypothetical protein
MQSASRTFEGCLHRMTEGARAARKPALSRNAIAAAIITFAICSGSAHAQKHGQAMYESGTSTIASDTIAPIIAAPEALRFESPTPLVIRYENIDNAAWRKDVREHMGFFPAMFVGMVAAREHVYRLTLSYRTDSGEHQAAVFQLDRDDAIALSELLRVRVPQCKEKNNCMALFDE